MKLSTPSQCFAILAQLLFFAVSSMAESHTPIGKWKTIDDNDGTEKAIIEIWEENRMLNGKVVEVLDADADPVCNKCKGDLKGKPVVGLRILWDLKKDGDEWTDGKILDPKNGKTYTASMKLSNGGKQLDVRGYVLVFYRTQQWYRVE